MSAHLTKHEGEDYVTFPLGLAVASLLYTLGDPRDGGCHAHTGVQDGGPDGREWFEYVTGSGELYLVPPEVHLEVEEWARKYPSTGARAAAAFRQEARTRAPQLRLVNREGGEP